MKTKKKKGLNLSKKTKIIMTITITIITMIIIIASYNYGNIVGHLKGYHHAVGTEGICDILDYTMEEEYCVISEPNKYKHYMECPHGKFIVYGEKEYKLMNLDPRNIIMQCTRTKVEMIH